MDLGRIPEIRFADGSVILHSLLVSEADLQYVVEHISSFGDDNRAGIERTLHRISAIRNRRGKIIGLTCRVGRAVFGAIALVRDVIAQGRSILILGRPGVGKTTLLREMARVLADDFGKRVVIVDTSNEIAGDGDIPHSGIGKARRLQVARTAQQHMVMIEAVENHMPEVIVIDEIGNELEALAARTIAERGVQLIATAHGNTLDNLMLNPTLSDLIGGIGAVTLGDEEARRRGTQKTVLERKSPPTFDIVIEQQDREKILIHANVTESVDDILRGGSPSAIIRTIENGKVFNSMISYTSARAELSAHTAYSGFADRPYKKLSDYSRSKPSHGRHYEELRAGEQQDSDKLPANTAHIAASAALKEYAEKKGDPLVPLAAPKSAGAPLRVALNGISESAMKKISAEFGAKIRIVNGAEQPDILFMSRDAYQNAGSAATQNFAKTPLVVVNPQELNSLRKGFAQSIGVPFAAPEDIYGEPDPEQPAGEQKLSRRQRKNLKNSEVKAMREAEDAIHLVLLGKSSSVDLTPQAAPIRRQQHLLARRYNVTSHSFGREPFRRVRITSA